MHQTFDTPPCTGNRQSRLNDLRQYLDQLHVDAFLVPRTDAHRGEIVPQRDERLAWLTGFTGSAGFAAITSERAVLYVDGRYTLQAQNQVPDDAIEIAHIPKDKLSVWLTDTLPRGSKVGFDPWLHTAGEIEKLKHEVEEAGIAIDPCRNLVDLAWKDQPPPPAGQPQTHAFEYAGETATAKRQRIAELLTEKNVEAAVLTVPESICWLLNIRGRDIPRTPVVLAFALIFADGTVWLGLSDPNIPDDLVSHLGDQVTIGAKEDFETTLGALTGRIGIDKTTAPVAVTNAISAKIVEMRDPCVLPKAIKSEAEIAGTRAAQLRDGAAMISFLAWLDAQEAGSLTEIDVVRSLESFRQKTGALQDISFETISGAGPNGAIVHYRVTESTNAKIDAGSLLLVDSGGQYLDGTTDITRTMAIGPAKTEAIRPFTLVLKGMIAMSRLRWPEGLAGRDLDAIARSALWEAGFDYDHGTGHGVGSYLSVHEGPAGLSRRSKEPLKPGMILSNEPGYYRTNAFGIRIENLILVEEPSTPQGGDRPMLGFETLTYVPIDRRLIDPDLLTPAERDWLNAYHHETARRYMTGLPAETAHWLEMATAPI